MRKALGAVVLGSLVLLVNPVSASAHADLHSSNPINGALVSSSPKSVVLVFSEAVELNSAELLSNSAQSITSQAKIAGATLTITPTRKMASGPLAAQWEVTSDDGHVITGAISFIVGKPTSIGKPVPIVTLPKIAVNLSGNRAGSLRLNLAAAATSGEIQWTHQSLQGPITWRATGNGKKVSATGVLPFAGDWTMNATLIGKGGSVLITTGKVHLV